MSYKIRKSLQLFHSDFYRNVACYHLNRPTLRKMSLYDCDGIVIPIVHVDTGAAQ